jgi:DNA-binding XRE family transcriptional regulator
MIVNSTEELGQRLRERRLALALTQDQVAGIVGVNRRVLGELERGKSTVRLGIALEVARVLGLDIDLTPRSR